MNKKQPIMIIDPEIERIGLDQNESILGISGTNRSSKKQALVSKKGKVSKAAISKSSYLSSKCTASTQDHTPLNEEKNLQKPMEEGSRGFHRNLAQKLKDESFSSRQSSYTTNRSFYNGYGSDTSRTQEATPRTGRAGNLGSNRSAYLKNRYATEDTAKENPKKQNKAIRSQIMSLKSDIDKGMKSIEILSTQMETILESEFVLENSEGETSEDHILKEKKEEKNKRQEEEIERNANLQGKEKEKRQEPEETKKETIVKKNNEEKTSSEAERFCSDNSQKEKMEKSQRNCEELPEQPVVVAESPVTVSEEPHMMRKPKEKCTAPISQERKAIQNAQTILKDAQSHEKEKKLEKNKADNLHIKNMLKQTEKYKPISSVKLEICSEANKESIAKETSEVLKEKQENEQNEKEAMENSFSNLVTQVPEKKPQVGLRPFFRRTGPISSSSIVNMASIFRKTENSSNGETSKRTDIEGKTPELIEKKSFYEFLFSAPKLKASKDQAILDLGVYKYRETILQIIQGLKYVKNIVKEPTQATIEGKKIFLDRKPKNASNPFAFSSDFKQTKKQ